MWVCKHMFACVAFFIYSWDDVCLFVSAAAVSQDALQGSEFKPVALPPEREEQGERLHSPVSWSQSQVSFAGLHPPEDVGPHGLNQVCPTRDFLFESSAVLGRSCCLATCWVYKYIKYIRIIIGRYASPLEHDVYFRLREEHFTVFWFKSVKPWTENYNSKLINLYAHTLFLSGIFKLL